MSEEVEQVHKEQAAEGEFASVKEVRLWIEEHLGITYQKLASVWFLCREGGEIKNSSSCAPGQKTRGSGSV
jgi:hypothetical protein